MSSPEAGNATLRCREETVLTSEEKRLFDGFFREYELSEDIFTYFESLVRLSTKDHRFIFLKVLIGQELVGLAMFARVRRNSLYQSLNSHLREHSSTTRLLKFLKGTLYFSMHSVSSPGLPGAFLYRDKLHEDIVVEAILSWMKKKDDADTIVVIDSAEKSKLYSDQDFICLPFASDSWLDVTRYETLDDYLSVHRQTRKHIGRLRKNRNVTVETFRGGVPNEIKEGMGKCLRCSVKHSKSLLPVQEFFNKNIFRTALFTSERFIHFVIRIDGRVAGFSTRLSCDKNLIGLIGGYDRENFGDAPVYDLMIVSTLDYCIQKKYRRLVYGIIDNHTKARMMDTFRGQRFYAYGRNPLSRLLLKHVYRFSSAYELSRIELDFTQRRTQPT
jgi:hypothetical protein